jgi:hypothetical protein
MPLHGNLILGDTPKVNFLDVLYPAQNVTLEEINELTTVPPGGNFEPFLLKVPIADFKLHGVSFIIKHVPKNYHPCPCSH